MLFSLDISNKIEMVQELEYFKMVRAGTNQDEDYTIDDGVTKFYYNAEGNVTNRGQIAHKFASLFSKKPGIGTKLKSMVDKSEAQ